MEPLIARAFVTLIMDDEQLKRLKHNEVTRLPPGRYAQAFEILYAFSLPSETITPERESKMKMVLTEWQKINWKKNQIEDKNHEKLCVGMEVGKCKCRTYQQEVHEWMEFVKANYIDPLPTAKRRTSDKFQNSDESGAYGDPTSPSIKRRQSDLGEVPGVFHGME